MGLNALQDKTRALASANIVGVPAPTEKVAPTSAEITANSAAITAWENARQLLIDGTDTVAGISEAEADAQVGPRPIDLSDDTKWPVVEKKHEAITSFVDGGMWQDRTTSLYILSVGLAELIDEARYSDTTVRNKVNELVDAVNYILYFLNPPAISVPPTKQITTPLEKI